MKRNYDFYDLSKRYGFSIREIEKVCRISDVLESLSDVRFLRDRLSLYGGTSLVFIHYKEILRLSVDLDLNYRHIDGKDWGEDRKEIDERIKALLYSQGYELGDIAINATWPLTRFTIQYKNTQGLNDSFKIELGYMRRYPVLKKDTLEDFKHIGIQETFQIKTPQAEELFANKWCTLLHRKTPRDLFDIYQISSLQMNHDVFRKCAVIDSLMRTRPKLYEIDIDQAIGTIPLNSSLRNVLQTERVSEYDFDDIRRRTIQFSSLTMKEISEKEIKLIDQVFDSKKFDPDLIDETGIFHENLREHPSILWTLRRRDVQD